MNNVTKYESNAVNAELDNLRKLANETRVSRTGWFSSKTELTNPELHNIIAKHEQSTAALAAETAIDIAKEKAKALVQKTKDSVAADVQRNQLEIQRAGLSVQAQVASSVMSETIAVTGQISRSVSDNINKLEADTSLDPSLKALQVDVVRSLAVNTMMNLTEHALTITKGGVK